jgi:uncharacterized protein (DUF433 family)
MYDLVKKYITADPNYCQGKPRFRGTRLPVYIVLELLEGGVKPETICGKKYYPELKKDHIRAALQFAAQYARNLEIVLYHPRRP